ncbi:hypothetical protein [Streptomyces sp. SID14515]|uniref:hypothetical protein n=1 Tax=Streptomyces sp. SID14515 TaxID=2706074 RepID=UPI0013C80845|nr:hypothetical protein [Streptomyces sp. SID14515]NEB42578.1 hypothetical protein [Streptomyces sp. SID14515]
MTKSQKRLGGKNGAATDGYKTVPHTPIQDPNPKGNRAQRRAAAKEARKRGQT